MRALDVIACCEASRVLNQLRLVQDYARWHSYQFYLSVRTVDPTMRPKGSLDVSPSSLYDPFAIAGMLLANMPMLSCSWALPYQGFRKIKHPKQPDPSWFA